MCEQPELNTIFQVRPHQCHSIFVFYFAVEYRYNSHSAIVRGWPNMDNNSFPSLSIPLTGNKRWAFCCDLLLLLSILSLPSRTIDHGFACSSAFNHQCTRRHRSSWAPTHFNHWIFKCLNIKMGACPNIDYDHGRSAKIFSPPLCQFPTTFISTTRVKISNYPPISVRGCHTILNVSPMIL